MSEGARIDSPEVIREVRVYWIKFDDTIRQSVSGIKSDIQRTIQWLQHEQSSYWKSEFRKAEEAVRQARSDYTMARHGSESMRKNSYVDEQKRLRKAEARKEECEKKMEVTRRWCNMLPQQIEKMIGPVDGLGNSLENVTPRALQKLDSLATKLEEYLRDSPSSPL